MAGILLPAATPTDSQMVTVRMEKPIAVPKKQNRSTRQTATLVVSSLIGLLAKQLSVFAVK